MGLWLDGLRQRSGFVWVFEFLSVRSCCWVLLSVLLGSFESCYSRVCLGSNWSILSNCFFGEFVNFHKLCLIIVFRIYDV